jgi:hypothetical protein
MLRHGERIVRVVPLQGKTMIMDEINDWIDPGQAARPVRRGHGSAGRQSSSLS